MKAYDELMKEFMDKYGQFRRSDPGPIPITVALLRLRLITEEYCEFLTDFCPNDLRAEVMEDREKVADALGDLAYVLIGTIVTYGFRFNGMSHVEPGGQPYRRQDIAAEMGKAMAAVVTVLHEYQMNLEHPAEPVTNALHEMTHTVIVTAKSLGIPFDPVFREIHRSNMTKAVPTTSTETGQKYGIKIGAGGKGQDYQPPNLRPILFPSNCGCAPGTVLCPH